MNDLIITDNGNNFLTIPELDDTSKERWRNVGLMFDKDLKPNYWLYVNIVPYVGYNKNTADLVAKTNNCVLPTVAELNVFLAHMNLFLHENKYTDIEILSSEKVLGYDNMTYIVNPSFKRFSIIDDEYDLPYLYTFLFKRIKVSNTVLQ